MSGRGSDAGQLTITGPAVLHQRVAEFLAAHGLVFLVVALEPVQGRVALEGQDVRADAVEEEPVVADDDRATGEVLQRLLVDLPGGTR